MRPAWSLAAVLAAAASVAMPAEYVMNPPVSVERMRLDVRLIPDENEIIARADLELRAERDRVESFNLWLNQGFRVDQIRPTRGLEFAWERDREPPHFAPTTRAMRIDLAHPLQRGERQRLSIFYRGRIQSLVNGVNIISPGLVELALYSGWFPRVVGAGDFDVEVIAEARGRMTILSHAEPVFLETGKRRTRARFSMRSRFEDVPLLAAPGMQVRERQRNGVRARVYNRDLSDEVAESILSAMLWIEAHHRERLGLPAATDRLDLFVSPRGGWNYARAPLLVMSRDALRHGVDTATPEGRRGFASLAHEVGHLWWRLASNYTYDDWLNEGLAEYCGLLALEARGGEEASREQLQRYARSVRGLPSAHSIGVTLRSDPESEVLFFAKAALVLRQLRGVMGQKAFGATMAEYYRTYHDARPDEADTVAFRRIAERFHGDDLVWFFQPWVYDAVLPELRLDYELQAVADGGWLVEGTVRRDADDELLLPVELLARGPGSESRTFRLRMDGPEAGFSFQVPFRPVGLELTGLATGPEGGAGPPSADATRVAELLGAARRREERGEPGAAHRLYEEVLAGDPDNFYSLYRLGRLAVEEGDLPAGLAHHRRADATRNGYPEMWGWNLVRIGEILDRQGDREEAAAAYRQALAEGDYRGSHEAARRGLGREEPAPPGGGPGP